MKFEHEKKKKRNILLTTPTQPKNGSPSEIADK